MKKLILLLAIALTSCSTAPIDKNADTSHRIVGKEYNVYEGYGYQIIEVDGREYISCTSGGMCPLVKDSLK